MSEAEKTPRQLWVEALRSGAYVQSTGTLRRGDKFCCLGVACVVAADNGVPVIGREDVDTRWVFITPTDQSMSALPNEVREWLGMRTPSGNFTENRGQYALSEKNDTGYTFRQIADIIESEPEGLFAE